MQSQVDNKNMATEKELLERIRELEAQNSALQDKLDMIWSHPADIIGIRTRGSIKSHSNKDGAL